MRPNQNSRFPIVPTGLLLALLALGAGCPGPEGDGDGGSDLDGGTDAGSNDDGGGGADGGNDAGCSDPECLPCAAGGTLCADGGVCLDGGCVESCVPGASRCQGPALQGCGDGGTYDPVESCGIGGLCVGDACVAVTDCSTETPPCCSQAADCGNMAELFTCSECRRTIRTTACLAGACEVLPATLDFTVLGDTANLPDPTRVASGVITVYRGVTADGRSADCATLLDEVTGASPHDDRDPQLNPTVSRPYEFTGGTGTDLFTTLVLGSPGGGDQTIVFSVYDDARGRGLRLGRGCTDHVTPLSGQTLTLSLYP